MFLNKNVYSEDSVTGLFDVGDSGWTFLMWDVRLLYFIDVGDSAAGLFSSWQTHFSSIISSFLGSMRWELQA